MSGSLGYLTIGMNIDPKDWHRPLARQIVAATVEGAKRGDGNVVLLHDAGGNPHRDHRGAAARSSIRCGPRDTVSSRSTNCWA